MTAYFASDKELNLLHPEAQKIFRRLIESVHSGILMADAKGNIFYANSAMAAILGYESKDELLGRNMASELFADSQQKEAFLYELEKRGDIQDYEIKSFKKNKEPITLSATCNVIRNDRGQSIGTEGIFLDVTGKKRLEEDLKIEKHKLEQILEFNEKISTIRDPNELSKYLVEKTSQILDAQRCSLMMFDDESRELHIQSATGLSDEIISTTKIKLGEPIAGAVAQGTEPLLVKNIDYDKRFAKRAKPSYHSRSFMSAAVRRDNKLIGVLNVADKNPNVREAFSELDLKILSAIVRQAAISLENTKLYKELEYLSMVDPLTDVCNYRTFVKSLDQEIHRLKRFAGTLSLLMIDVDDFKRINDTYGHLEGDHILRKISEIFKSNLRDLDTVCRYGGDEFAVILPETTSEQARIVAEKLREKVEHYPFKEKVSLSIGIAEYEPSLSRYELTQKADKALYAAKKEGKNRIDVGL